MASLAEQLKAVQLKKSKEPIKDYSDPKLAGFASEKDIKQYQRCVLDVNIEKWLDILKEETFPTQYCAITLDEVKTFVSVFEKLFNNKDSTLIADIEWKDKLTDDQKTKIDWLRERLQKVMDPFVTEDGYAFVKTSSRSAKDAPTAQKRFKDIYANFTSGLPTEDRNNENSQITCILQAAFECLKVSSASEVVDMFIRSERIHQDFLLALDQVDVFCENFVVRKFVQIEVDMEFRGFVFNNSFTALSQYNYAIHSKKLADSKQKIETLVRNYFEEKVKPKLEASNFAKDFIIDFAVCENGEKVWVIEINPFLVSTDGALFSWEHERDILEGKHGFQFRITERPRPGARTILPHSIKALLDL